MADKPVAEVVAADAIIDALVSPTSSDVYEATLPFNPHAIAASAVRRAGEGGGGGGAVVSCSLHRDSTFEVQGAGNHPILWDTLYDNEYDFNVLGAIPTGLGLDFAFDGSASEVTTTEAGVWSFTYQIVYGADDSFLGSLETGFGAQTFQPLGGNSSSWITTNVLALPTAAEMSNVIFRKRAPTAGTYVINSVVLLIARLG